MKIKFIALLLCAAVSSHVVKGQETTANNTQSMPRHEIRLSASDGLILGLANVFGMGLSDAVTGSKRSDEKSSLVYSLGYRYSIARFRVGADLGFVQSTGKLTLIGETAPSLKEKDLNFMLLPTVEFVYFKRGVVELYGGASAGVNLVNHTEKSLNQTATSNAKKSDLSTNFAYQVNPIALRVGNQRIGGFLEAGLGYKGFVTAGVSLRF
ncbi:hypothetical protein [Barnesiella sp. An22]|uniref:hypothetical protein n=1 Tax=Barnesiella sp. An22 TaxID=1965590 RepID=UPI000B36A797|nr:hypothetical protein [Barnesiella sp. An22]OUO96485.1 hypothetical protein B5F38_13010 [Barnesiella sp. An22]